MTYRAGHIPGAVWAIRPRVRLLRKKLQAARNIVVYADSDSRAALLAGEIRRIAEGARISVLQGGTSAWLAASFGLEQSPLSPSDDECIDYLFWAHDRQKGNDAASLEYFRWELGLPAQLANDGTARVRIAR
jgi:cystathionine beta-lyase